MMGGYLGECQVTALTQALPRLSPSHLTLHCITLSRVRFTLGLWVILLYSFINDFEIYLNNWQLIAR